MEIQQIKFDKDALQHKIKFAIENLYGIDSMVYSPFKAFEGVAREQILLFKEPVQKCLDLVIDELIKAVRVCSVHVSNFLT